MSLAATLLLAAAAAAQAASAESGDLRGQGAQVESATVTAQILRPAVLKGGAIVSADSESTPRTQTRTRDGRVTYEFE